MPDRYTVLKELSKYEYYADDDCHKMYVFNKPMKAQMESCGYDTFTIDTDENPPKAKSITPEGIIKKWDNMCGLRFISGIELDKQGNKQGKEVFHHIVEQGDDIYSLDMDTIISIEEMPQKCWLEHHGLASNLRSLMAAPGLGI